MHYVQIIVIVCWVDELFSHEKYRIAPDVSQTMTPCYLSPKQKFKSYFSMEVKFHPYFYTNIKFEI